MIYLQLFIMWSLGMLAGYCIGWGQAKRRYARS
jgi:hypothetical protein